MKNNRKRFYRLLFSFTFLFVLVSLLSLWYSKSPNMMSSEMTMGMDMIRSIFSGMTWTDLFTTMGQMMGEMQGMMPTNPIIVGLNLVLTLALIIFTLLLIGASIIFIMLWK